MLGVEQWAQIRRMKYVERLSQREIHRRTGVHRDTIRRALASPQPPSYGPRPRRPSQLDPFRATIEELLGDEPTLSGVRIREELETLGYRGGKTILDDLLRELRPRFLPSPRSFQRTRYRPGELAQFDLCEPRREIAVGYGQTRRGYIVTCELPYSRAFAGALVFSKELRRSVTGGRRRRLPERVGFVWIGQAEPNLSRRGFSADVRPYPFPWDDDATTSDAIVKPNSQPDAPTAALVDGITPAAANVDARSG